MALPEIEFVGELFRWEYLDDPTWDFKIPVAHDIPAGSGLVFILAGRQFGGGPSTLNASVFGAGNVFWLRQRQSANISGALGPAHCIAGGQVLVPIAAGAELEFVNMLSAIYGVVVLEFTHFGNLQPRTVVNSIGSWLFPYDPIYTELPNTHTGTTAPITTTPGRGVLVGITGADCNMHVPSSPPGSEQDVHTPDWTLGTGVQLAHLDIEDGSEVGAGGDTIFARSFPFYRIVEDETGLVGENASGGFADLVGAWATAGVLFRPLVLHGLSLVRNPLAGQGTVVYVGDQDTPESGEIRADQRDDAEDDTVAATSAAVDGDETWTPRTMQLPDGSLACLYRKGNGVWLAWSDDGGVTWGNATELFTGYDHAIIAWGTALDQRPMPAIALFQETTKRWTLSVGTLAADGSSFTWTAPQPMMDFDAYGAYGSLCQRPNGTWDFLWRGPFTDPLSTSQRQWWISHCADLGADGSGDWSTTIPAYANVTDVDVAVLAWGRGLAGAEFPVLVGWGANDHTWRYKTGRVVDATSITWLGVLTAGTAMGITGPLCIPDLQQRESDGVWEFIHRTVAGNWAIKRSSNLRANDGGSWA